MTTTGYLLEHLQNGYDDVIDVAEARGLELLGVVESPGPVDGDVAAVVIQLDRTLQGCSRVHGAEVV